MEKRIFLAFLISFLFLTLWAKVAAPPPSAIKANRSVVATLPAEQAPALSRNLAIPFSVEKAADFPEQTIIFENAKLRVEFTNVGGTIKKITDKQYNTTLPVTNILTVAGVADKEFTFEKPAARTIVYSFSQGGTTVQKTYSLAEDDYLIEANVEMSKEAVLNMYTLDISRMDKINDRDKSLFEYSIASGDKIFRKSNTVTFDLKENKSLNQKIDWFGYRDRYFAFIVKPEFESSQYSATVLNNKSIGFSIVPRETSGQSNYKTTIFFGPQQKEALSKYNQGFEKIVLFSNWGIIDGTAKIIYSSLVYIHKIIRNWGLSIIILGVLIYLLTYPLTMAGMSSMRKMQSLQPQMTKLREQHKNNPQKLNQEMMELYKKHKVNPMGGCLPMIIQMPIFIGLYQILWRSVILKGQPFLWIKDLSEPDRIIVLKQAAPLIGNDFNILPILMGIVMFFQQKLSVKAMNVSDPAQLSQQKMMLWMMPIMMLFIFYKAASGLTLYFTVLYALTTFTQWKVAKSVSAE